MKHRHAPRIALALLERVVPGSEPLVGDLLEQFEAHPSTIRLWVQVLAAIAATWMARGGEIRPLHLVDLQPADAAERTRRFSLRFPALTLTASPTGGVGGLGLGIFVGLLTATRPATWSLFLASAAAGVVLGLVMIVVNSKKARRTGPLFAM